MHTNYHARIGKAFDVASESSNALISEILSAITDIIMNDLTPALCKLFTKSGMKMDTRKRASRRLLSLVVETISEYMGEMMKYPVYQLLFVIFG